MSLSKPNIATCETPKGVTTSEYCFHPALCIRAWRRRMRSACGARSSEGQSMQVKPRFW